ncbi:hypothetical protein M2322_004580 [Rhodoblastus acidophilus]|uniref:DUF1186 family protein n=3 Tax=Rhodoblastus acidophilus TaxID=1074 RepID=UPI0022258AEE|nr:DUF1186 family protein [Rhodoblastus acidophilus]MCW2319011.1 hypothetical protein [Rhodoblastus acidophilus]
MTPEQIFKALSRNDDEFPEAALQAALQQRDALAPMFEAEAERLMKQFDEIMDKSKTEKQYAAAGEKLMRTPSPLFYGFLLAAEWKRKEAYRYYAYLLAWSWAGTPNLLSEIVYSDQAARLMAEIYDGDPTPLFNLLVDQYADQSYRFWQFRTLILLVKKGALDLATVKDFLIRAFDLLEQEPEQHVWRGWEQVIIYFGLDELIPLVERAHKAEWILEGTIEEFRERWAYARAHPEAPIEGDVIAPYQGFDKEVAEAFANRARP